MIVLPSKEPLFASGEIRKGQVVVYLDHEGMMACTNLFVLSKSRICCVCGNACIQFHLDEKDGTYTCSACGKFPRELLLQ